MGSCIPGYGQDVSRTWEAVLMGAIPIVNYKDGLNPLFNESPVMKLQDWNVGYTKQELLSYKVPTISRKTLMYQYWNDKIQCIKKSIAQ